MANHTAHAERGWFISLMAVLFALLAISDFAKPLEFVHETPTSGIVEFGHRFHSASHSAILGVVFGVLFLAYAYGLWNLRAWVLPIAIGYAFYVPFNVTLFNYNREAGSQYPLAFTVIWLAIALTGSIGTAIYLAYNRKRIFSAWSSPEHIAPPPFTLPQPAAGSVVDEITMTLSSTGEPMATYRIWHDPLGSNMLEIQETTEAHGQIGVNYWVLPARGTGCRLAGVERWTRDGRLVGNNLWRNDPATLQIPGAMDFPDNMYPTISIPIDSFYRALESNEGSDIAKVNLQVSPYTFITLDTWKSGSKSVKTQAGDFNADIVAVHPDVATMLPSWPAALRAAVSPFFPKLTLDYDATPPHHLINFHGPMGWPAPAVDLQLTHRFVATDS